MNGAQARTASPAQPTGLRLAAAVAAAVGSATAAGVATAAAAKAAAPHWSSDLDKLAPLVIAVVYCSVIGALVLVLGRDHALRRGLLAVRGVSRGEYLVGAGVWTSAYVVAAVYYWVSGLAGASGIRDAADLLMSVGADNGRLADSSATLTALIIVRVLVLSPVAEELLFRGALYTWLRTRVSATATIAITASLFALIHQSPTFMPLALAVGIAAGILRERTGSVLVPIALHAAQSGVVVLLSLLLTGWNTPALLG